MKGAVSRWGGLAVACLGMSIIFLTITETISTLAPAQQDLGLSGDQLVWVTAAYAIVVASLVLSAGTIGDLIGRRRTFMGGTAFLGIGAVMVAFAQGPALLIAGQAVMGLGGAIVLPNSLAIVTHMFTDAHERTTAVSIWTAVSGIGLAVGPIAAGVFSEVWTWQAVFGLNAVVAIVVLALAPRLVPESRHTGRHLDPPGLVLAIAAIASLSYGVIQGGHDGFGTTGVVAAFAISVATIATFIAFELRTPTPMLHLRQFRRPAFSTANAVGLVGQYGFAAIAITESLHFERVRGDSILAAGFAILPAVASYVIVSFLAARVVRRLGFRATMTTGLAMIAAGFTALLWQHADTGALALLVPFAVFGAGAGLTLPPATAAAVVSVPHEEGGMASGTVNMFRQVGNTLGAAITGTIITSALAHPAPGESVGDAFTGGLHLAVLIPAVGAILAAVAVALVLRDRPAAATAPQRAVAARA